MKKFISCLLIVSMVVHMTVAAQEEVVRNIHHYREGNNIIIRYDLLPHSKRGTYSVKLLVSDDGGRSYMVTLKALSGHIGTNVQPGSGNRIVWSLQRDLPQGFDNNHFSFRIIAEREKRGRGFLYVLLGAVVAGGGAAAYFILNSVDSDDGFPAPPQRPQ